MEKNIFTAGEGYCEYSQEQIKLLKENILSNFVNNNKPENDSENSFKENDSKYTKLNEDEDDYILGLA